MSRVWVSSDIGLMLTRYLYIESEMRELEYQTIEGASLYMREKIHFPIVVTSSSRIAVYFVLPCQCYWSIETMVRHLSIAVT